MSPRASDPVARFWQKVDRNGPGGCWLWTASTVKGYGQLGISNGVREYAHRFSWELHRSRIPDGLQIDHLCRVPRCVNPDHLEPVTAAENLARQVAYRDDPTRCRRGHARTPENTYVPPKGTRECRTCTAEAKARYEATVRKPARHEARKRRAA